MRRPQGDQTHDKKAIHIPSDGGLTHEAISQTTNTSISTVQFVLREVQPTLSEICSEKVERPHGSRSAVVDPTGTNYFNSDTNFFPIVARNDFVVRSNQTRVIL